MTERTIELHRAFVFDCPDCGKESMVRMVRDEDPAARTEEALRKHYGVKPWESIPQGLMDAPIEQLPPMAGCGVCGVQYRTEWD